MISHLYYSLDSSLAWMQNIYQYLLAIIVNGEKTAPWISFKLDPHLGYSWPKYAQIIPNRQIRGSFRRQHEAWVDLYH